MERSLAVVATDSLQGSELFGMCLLCSTEFLSGAEKVMQVEVCVGCVWGGGNM